MMTDAVLACGRPVPEHLLTLALTPALTLTLTKVLTLFGGDARWLGLGDELEREELYEEYATLGLGLGVGVGVGLGLAREHLGQREAAGGAAAAEAAEVGFGL